MTYLEFRCPNKPNKNTELECRAELAGPSIDSLKAHNFNEYPFEDIRYCQKCKTFWKITIRGVEGCVAEYDLIPKQQKVKFTKPLLDVVKGRRIKSKGKGNA